MWRSLIAFMASLAAEPGAVDREHPRAAAACQAAYAAMARDDAPPAPKPVDECVCGQTCKNGVWKPDGRIEAKCDCECARCKAERTAKPVPACPNGRCPTPGASPATVSPAGPAGRR
jgi:hypothetical protein